MRNPQYVTKENAISLLGHFEKHFKPGPLIPTYYRRFIQLSVRGMSYEIHFFFRLSMIIHLLTLNPQNAWDVGDVADLV